MTKLDIVSPDEIEAPASGEAKGFRIKNLGQETLVLIATLVVVVICSVLIPGFLSLANFTTLARSVSVLGILAVGMSIVVIGRGLDLSQVAVMAICAAWAMKLTAIGLPLAAGVGAGLGFALLIGFANGFCVSIVGIPPLFATLASGIFVFGIGRWILLNGINTYVPKDATAVLTMGQGDIHGAPVSLIIFALVALTAHLVLSRTTLGRFVYAFGDNADAARLTGVSVRVLTIYQYCFSAAVAYLAGLVTAGEVAAIDTNIVNSSLIFDVLLVVVLGGISLSGGRGSILSVLAGTALIGTLLNAMILLDVQGDVENIAKKLGSLGGHRPGPETAPKRRRDGAARRPLAEAILVR